MKLSEYKAKKEIKELVSGKLFEKENIQEDVIVIEEKLTPKEEKVIDNHDVIVEEKKPKRMDIGKYKEQLEIKRIIEESFKEISDKKIKEVDNIVVSEKNNTTKEEVIEFVTAKLKKDPFFIAKLKENLNEEKEIEKELDTEPRPVVQPQSNAFTGGGFTVTQINSLIQEYLANHQDATAVDSVFGRTGNIISQTNDYNSSQIRDTSNIDPLSANETVSDALKFLHEEIHLLSLSAGAVTSVFGRALDVVAAVNDYSASYIKNDSSVSGSSVKTSLNYLNNNLIVLSAYSHHLSASQIKNDSSVSGTYIRNSLNYLNSIKAPISHSVNANTYGYATTANAGHVRIGDGLSISNGTVINNFYPSVGILKDIIPVDNGNGTITLPQTSAVFYNNSINRGLAKSYVLSAITTNVGGFPDISQGLSYLIAKYNNGNPIYSYTTNVTDINLSNVIPIATIFRYNNDLHILDWDEPANGLADKLQMRLIKTERFKIESGLSIGIGTGRKVTVTPGTYWIGAHRINTSAFDSSDVLNGTYLLCHTTSAGTWIQTSGTQFNNTQYDTGTGLTNLSGNRFNINWVYLCASTNEKNHVFSILSNTQYNTLSEARLSQPRTDVPDQVKSFGVLLGRIIVQQNSSTGVVESSWVETFNVSTVIDHNDTSNLNTGDYLHLNRTQYNSISASNNIVRSVFGRHGNIVTQVGDYSASYIKNDSSVSGSSVKNALNVLNNNIINGYVSRNMTYVTKTSAYNIVSSDMLIRCSGTFVVKLPTANGSGRNYNIKNIGNGIVTLSGGIIDGETTKIIDSKYSNITVVDTGINNWDII